MDQPSNTTELKFGSGYGKIVSYRLLDGGLVAVGFDSGQFVLASTVGGKVAKEVFSQKLFGGGMSSLAVSAQTRRAAACHGKYVQVPR